MSTSQRHQLTSRTNISILIHLVSFLRCYLIPSSPTHSIFPTLQQRPCWIDLEFQPLYFHPSSSKQARCLGKRGTLSNKQTHQAKPYRMLLVYFYKWRWSPNGKWDLFSHCTAISQQQWSCKRPPRHKTGYIFTHSIQLFAFINSY